jgi:hypothetical protein
VRRKLLINLADAAEGVASQQESPNMSEQSSMMLVCERFSFKRFKAFHNVLFNGEIRNPIPTAYLILPDNCARYPELRQLRACASANAFPADYIKLPGRKHGLLE